MTQRIHRHTLRGALLLAAHFDGFVWARATDNSGIAVAPDHFDLVWVWGLKKVWLFGSGFLIYGKTDHRRCLLSSAELEN